jgi:hypothetical protein
MAKGLGIDLLIECATHKKINIFCCFPDLLTLLMVLQLTDAP